MKKLLILIIVLACMGCSEECLEADWVLGPEPGATHGGPCDYPNDECGWFRDWNKCTCQCDWIF